MIANEDITVVVQGPVQSLPDRDQEEGITGRCLTSVREHLPGSRIILSTWPAQNLSGLDYDELVINEDPGPNIVGYGVDASPKKENYNRQIVSTCGGLRRVPTRYAMKLRSDNYLTSDRFKFLQQAYPKRCDEYRLLKERVVANNTFTRQYARGMRVVFHTCDFFYFGLAGDVIDLWDIGLIDDFPYDPTKKNKLQHPGAPRFAPDATQDLWIRFLNKHLDPPIRLRHMHDVSKNLLRISNVCYANNLVIGSPADIGLGLGRGFTGTARAAKKSSVITYVSHREWQILYQRYCDPEYEVPDRIRFALANMFWRGVLVGPQRVGGWIRLARRRWQDRPSFTD